MAIDLRFVDKIDPSPATRLNLNDGTKWTFQRKPPPDFSPPPLKRALVDTLLRQGAQVAASAYDNRRLRFDLVVQGTDQDDLATELQKLNRELDRELNILKYQPEGATNPVYFRTLRSPVKGLAIHAEGESRLRCGIDLLAEPFAYGEKVQSTDTFDGDPAAVSKGLYIEVASVPGDVPTPLFMYAASMSAAPCVLGVRRHGTPALYWRQAEAMGQGQDTTTQPNDAAYSGTGNNFSRTTFATATAMTTRLTWSAMPGAGSSVEYRGTYRVFVRLKNTNGADVNRVRMVHGLVQHDTVELDTGTAFRMVDLGLVSVPASPDPVEDGFTNNPLPCLSFSLYLQAERVSGSGNLDWDFVVLVPADEELCLVWWAAADCVWDGPNGMVYEGDMSIVETSVTVPALVGSIPLLTPNQTNRLVLLRSINANVLAEDTPVTVRYWPRWLYVRP